METNAIVDDDSSSKHDEEDQSKIGLFVSSVMLQWCVRSTASYLQNHHWPYAGSLVSALGPATVILLGGGFRTHDTKSELRKLTERVQNLEKAAILRLPIKEPVKKRRREYEISAEKEARGGKP